MRGLVEWLSSRIELAKQQGLTSHVTPEEVLRAHSAAFSIDPDDHEALSVSLARIVDLSSAATCADTWIWVLGCDARRSPDTAKRSFATWYAAHRARLRTELGSGAADSGTLTDDAVTRFWCAYLAERASNHFVPRSSMFAMIAIIAKSIRLDEARARSRSARLLEHAATRPRHTRHAPLTADEQREFVQDVIECARTELTQAQRYIFERVHLDGCSQADVARELDISPSAVAKHNRLAIARLRDSVAKRRGVAPELLDELIADDTH